MNRTRTITIVMLLLFLGVAFPLMAYSQKQVPEFSTAGFFNDPQLRTVYNFNPAWRFFKGQVSGAERTDFDDKDWQLVNLPNGIELLPAEASGCINYQGEVWYRKHFTVGENENAKRWILHFEGIMGKSKVWINGTFIKESVCGYLPLVIDVTRYLKKGDDNVITVWADNSDDPNYPPGKAQDVLDFTYFGGIYRDAWLYGTNSIFITDPNEEDKVAGGGILIAYEHVSEQSADILLKTDVKNLSGSSFKGKVIYELFTKENQLVASSVSSVSISKGKSSQTNESRMKITKPHLWYPATPYLYNLIVKVVDNKGVVQDGYRQRLGIRSIEFRGKDGLFLNGKHYDKPLMGANRHQDFALIGHALPNSLHWRDAKKLKDLGMEIIRSAHFPQDPAWMDACDELGLFMIVTTPGWQFWNETPTFEQGVYDNIRQMVRRDRNHACIFLWEPILNETWYPDYFAKKVRDIVRDEFPYESSYSACDYRSKGREYFSIWYENAINFNKKNPSYSDKATENITFLQREWGDCVDDWTAHNGPSRVSRQWGETPMLIQANHYAKTNFQYICYDAFFKTTPQFIGGCMWHPFDHQRGYHPDPFYGGIMDSYRQPKTSYYLFKSFRSPQVQQESLAETGPFVYIANEMTPFSPEDVTVFSNCDKVVLTINKDGEKRVYERKPAEGMPYPIIRFPKAFSYVNDKIMSDTDNEKGVKRQQESYLMAEGYIDGKLVAQCKKQPARRPQRILLHVDDGGIQLRADGSDKVVVVASIVDEWGVVKRLNNGHIRFSIQGEGSLVGDYKIYANPVAVAWGTAPVIVQSTLTPGNIKIYAEMDYPGSQRPISGSIEIQSVTASNKMLYNDSEQKSAKKESQELRGESEKAIFNELKRENEELRLQLNNLKLKAVSTQQSEFNTATQHQ